jgi:hypothetical protein
MRYRAVEEIRNLAAKDLKGAGDDKSSHEDGDDSSGEDAAAHGNVERLCMA